MSEENNPASSKIEDKGSAPIDKQQYVSKSAFEEVSNDMHKYKGKLRERDAYVAELEAKQKSAEEATLAEKQQWEELYKKRDAEFENLQNEVTVERTQLLDYQKRSALKDELGGKVKDQYLIHADISSISFKEDGSIDSDSLLNVANSFRESHSELIPVVSSSQLTGTASPSDSTTNLGSELKPVSQMSFDEQKALLNNSDLQAEYRKQGLI